MLLLRLVVAFVTNEELFELWYFCSGFWSAIVHGRHALPASFNADSLLHILNIYFDRVVPRPRRSSASPVWFSFGSKLPCQLIPGSVDAAQPFAVHRTENEERRTALSVVGGNGSTTSTTLDRERARHARVKGGRQRRRRAVAAPAAAVGDHRRIPVRLLLDLFRCHHGDGHTTQAILAVDIQDQ